MNKFDQLFGCLGEPHLNGDELRIVISGFAQHFYENKSIKFVPPSSIDSISRSVFLEYLRNKNLLDFFYNYLLEHSLFPHLKDVCISQDNQPSLFVNRGREIDDAMRNGILKNPIHFTVVSPSGYGKTWLLNEIKRKYTNRDWQCIDVKIALSTTASSFVHDIAKQLRVTLDTTEVELISQLCSAWLSTNGDRYPKGLVFFVDSDNKLPEDILKFIVEEFIPSLSKCLNGTSRKLPIRTIIAGQHYLAKLPYIDASIIIPKPFRYRDVLDLVDEHVNRDVEENVYLAAHILYLTGGHPDSVANVIEHAKKSVDPGYLAEQDIVVWDRYIKSYASMAVNELRSTIENQELPPNFVDELSVYKHVDSHILTALIQAYSVDIAHPDDFLTLDSYYFKRVGNEIEHTTTHNVYGIFLWREYQDEFRKYCSNAQEFCKEQLIYFPNKEPARWIVAYLYQILQQHAGKSIILKGDRQTLIDGFFDNAVPDILGEWKKRKISLDMRKGQWRVIKQLFENISNDNEHREFKFTVNFYLRDDDCTFNNAPFLRLLDDIYKYGS